MDNANEMLHGTLSDVKELTG